MKYFIIYELITMQFIVGDYEKESQFHVITGVVILPRLGQAMAILGNSNIGNVAGNVFSIGNISNFVF